MVDLLKLKITAEGTETVGAKIDKNVTAALGRADMATAKLISAVGKVVAAYATWQVAEAVIRRFIAATAETERVQAQLAATLRSTGAASGQTMASLNAHADALKRISTFDDEAIGGAQALLLAFTRIHGDVFPKATQAVLDFATAMHTDLNSAAGTVGKALNDPIKGVQTLARAGVTFSASQKEMVKSLVETNKGAQAQAIILDELEKKFGGSAAAARDTLGGALQALENAFGDLFEATGPAADHLKDAINGLVTTISDPTFIQNVQNFGAALFSALSSVLPLISQILAFLNRLAGVSAGGVTNQLLEVSGAALKQELADTKELLRLALPSAGKDDIGSLFGQGPDARIKGYQDRIAQIEAELKAKTTRGAFDQIGLGGSFSDLQNMLGPTAGGSGDGNGWGPTQSQIDAAEKLAKAYDKITLSVQQKIAKSTLERQSIGLTADETLKLANRQDVLQDAEKAGLTLTEAQRAALTGYADKLTATQVETKKLEDAQKDAQAVFASIGSTIGEVFNGGIKSFDEFVDHLLTGFSQLGQKNLAKMFDEDSFNALFGSVSGTAANDNKKNGGWTNVFDAIKGGAKEGTSEGASSGLDNWFKSMGGKGGTAGMVSAGAGGLGLGYTSQNPLLGALGGAASGFMVGGAPGAVIGGIAGIIGGLFGMAEAAAKAKAELEKARDSINQFVAVGLGKEFSQYASALAQFTAQGKEFIETAKAAGDSDLAGKIQDAINAYPATLAKQLTDDLDRQLNAAQGKDYLNDITDAQKAYNQALADGALLGIDVSAKAQDVLDASLKKIATDAKLTTSQILVLAAQFPALANGLNALIGVVGGPSLEDLQQNVDDAQSKLRDAYNEQASLLKSTGDAARSAAKNIRDYLASLKTGPNSGLSPFDQLQAAQAQFAQVSQGALAGKKDDLDKLTGVSQDYLDAAKSYYASSTAYFQVLDSVEAILNQTANTQDSVATTADMQLAALNQQVGSLISIDNGVKSVADAIAALAAAQGALAVGQAANQNGATASGQVSALYSLLGRAPDASGAAYWQNQISSAPGGVLNSGITTAFLAAAIGNGETVDPALRAAYGLQNGGIVGNGIRGRDSVLASFAGGGHIALAGGEYVMPARQTAMYRGQLEAMRLGAGNDNASEIRALRADVAKLQAALVDAIGGGAMAVADKVHENTEAVKDQTTAQTAMRRKQAA